MQKGILFRNMFSNFFPRLVHNNLRWQGARKTVQKVMGSSTLPYGFNGLFEKEIWSYDQD